MNEIEWKSWLDPTILSKGSSAPSVFTVLGQLADNFIAPQQQRKLKAAIWEGTAGCELAMCDSGEGGKKGGGPKATRKTAQCPEDGGGGGSEGG